MRAFVLAFVQDGGRGAYARAYKTAGSKKLLRGAHPMAVKALLNLVADPSHRDHGRAVAMLLGRVDPETTKQDLSVTHRVVVSEDEELLQQYRAMLELGVSRDKMRSVLGGNTLLRLEQAEAKTVEGKVEE
jgi:hypothetical protein